MINFNFDVICQWIILTKCLFVCFFIIAIFATYVSFLVNEKVCMSLVLLLLEKLEKQKKNANFFFFCTNWTLINVRSWMMYIDLSLIIVYNILLFICYVLFCKAMYFQFCFVLFCFFYFCYVHILLFFWKIYIFFLFRFEWNIMCIKSRCDSHAQKPN